MKTKAVQAKLPIKLINRPNFGTIIAKIAVLITIIVLTYKRLNGLNLLILGNLEKKSAFSTI